MIGLLSRFRKYIAFPPDVNPENVPQYGISAILVFPSCHSPFTGYNMKNTAQEG